MFKPLGLWSKNKMRLHIWVVRTFSIKYCFKKLVFAVPFSKHLTALSHNKFFGLDLEFICDMVNEN